MTTYNFHTTLEELYFTGRGYPDRDAGEKLLKDIENFRDRMNSEESLRIVVDEVEKAGLSKSDFYTHIVSGLMRLYKSYFGKCPTKGKLEIKCSERLQDKMIRTKLTDLFEIVEDENESRMGTKKT